MFFFLFYGDFSLSMCIIWISQGRGQKLKYSNFFQFRATGKDRNWDGFHQRRHANSGESSQGNGIVLWNFPQVLEEVSFPSRRSLPKFVCIKNVVTSEARNSKKTMPFGKMAKTEVLAVVDHHLKAWELWVQLEVMSQSKTTSKKDHLTLMFPSFYVFLLFTGKKEYSLGKILGKRGL